MVDCEIANLWFVNIYKFMFCEACISATKTICKATLRNVMNFCDFMNFNYGTKPGTMTDNCSIHDANLEGKEIRSTVFKFKTFCLN